MFRRAPPVQKLSRTSGSCRRCAQASHGQWIFEWILRSDPHSSYVAVTCAHFRRWGAPRTQPLPAQQPLAEDDGEDEAPELSQDSDSESEPEDNDSDRDTWSAMFTDAWRGVMHSETTEKQMAAWESLNSRMAQMKEREGGSRQVPAQTVKAAPRKPGLDDPKLVPNPHETAFLRNASHLSENAVNEWLALLHDDSFTGTGPDRPTLRWNSAKTMKAFLKRSGARLGEIGVNSTTIPIGESMYCAI